MSTATCIPSLKEVEEAYNDELARNLLADELALRLLESKALDEEDIDLFLQKLLYVESSLSVSIKTDEDAEEVWSDIYGAVRPMSKSQPTRPIVTQPAVSPDVAVLNNANILDKLVVERDRGATLPTYDMGRVHRDALRGQKHTPLAPIKRQKTALKPKALAREVKNSRDASAAVEEKPAQCSQSNNYDNMLSFIKSESFAKAYQEVFIISITQITMVIRTSRARGDTWDITMSKGVNKGVDSLVETTAILLMNSRERTGVLAGSLISFIHRCWKGEKCDLALGADVLQSAMMWCIWPPGRMLYFCSKEIYELFADVQNGTIDAYTFYNRSGRVTGSFAGSFIGGKMGFHIGSKIYGTIGGVIGMLLGSSGGATAGGTLGEDGTKLLQQIFGFQDPVAAAFAELGLHRNTPLRQLNLTFRRMSLALHPDKHTENGCNNLGKLCNECISQRRGNKNTSEMRDYWTNRYQRLNNAYQIARASFQ